MNYTVTFKESPALIIEADYFNTYNDVITFYKHNERRKRRDYDPYEHADIVVGAVRGDWLAVFPQRTEAAE